MMTKTQGGYLDDVIFHIMMLHLIICGMCYDDKNTEGISWWCHYIAPDYLPKLMILSSDKKKTGQNSIQHHYVLCTVCHVTA